MSNMKNNNSSHPTPRSHKLRELLESIGEQPNKENHPLYKMGFEAGVKDAQENHRKLLEALVAVYNVKG